MQTYVVDIKRFAVHDGPGIRTTVFLKGCPLKCIWCHNPESISFEPQLAYHKSKCINCGECVTVCKNNSHVMEGNNHSYIRENCINCGACENVCLGEAVKLYGKQMTTEEVVDIVCEDKEFFDNSGGGVTLSGGECLMHPEFCRELLMKLKERNIHTAIDTCGFVSKDAIDMVMDYTDIFLYDIKAIDPRLHKRCTGRTNELILDNLKYIDGRNKDIEIRIPYVPDINSSEIPEIASFVKDLKHIKEVRVLPYHNFAGSKYEALNMHNTLPAKIADESEISILNRLFE